MQAITPLILLILQLAFHSLALIPDPPALVDTPCDRYRKAVACHHAYSISEEMQLDDNKKTMDFAKEAKPSDAQACRCLSDDGHHNRRPFVYADTMNLTKFNEFCNAQSHHNVSTCLRHKPCSNDRTKYNIACYDRTNHSSGKFWEDYVITSAITLPARGFDGWCSCDDDEEPAFQLRSFVYFNVTNNTAATAWDYTRHFVMKCSEYANHHVGSCRNHFPPYEPPRERGRPSLPKSGKRKNYCFHRPK